MIGQAMTREEALPARMSRLETLYEQHAAEAVRVAYLLTGDRALAEDLVQDAFVRLASRFADLREQAAFAAYLRKTIVNLARMHFRARSRERQRERRAAAGATAIPAGPPLEARDEIVRALARLPERQRAALVLRYYLDLTEADTADALGCRIGTVKSLTSRGLAALREHVTR
ncbi:MAG TPA: SigE family RNA polymerase sigma factor [Actinomycetota bacterium]